MKIQSVMIVRWNGDTPDTVILDGAYNLAEYSFFQKGRCAEAALLEQLALEAPGARCGRTEIPATNGHACAIGAHHFAVSKSS